MPGGRVKVNPVTPKMDEEKVITEPFKFLSFRRASKMLCRPSPPKMQTLRKFRSEFIIGVTL